MKYTEVIANRLQKFLDKKGLSKNDLIKKSGVSETTISNILNKKNVRPRISTLYHICVALDITVAEFYSDTKFI